MRLSQSFPQSRFGTAIAITSLFATGCTHATKETPTQPNVIFIYADDLGKGLLSAYGQTHYTTPHIDRLIHEGVSFDQAYGCMLSAPARASLLTGYHDCRSDKWKISRGAAFIPYNSSDEIAKIEAEIDSSDVCLANNDLYLAQVFQKAGYRTAQIGKLEWGFTATRNQMRAHGWDYFYGYLDHVRCHGYYPPYLFENDSIVMIEGNSRRDCGKSIENETADTYRERHDMEGKSIYSQDLFLEKIISFIKANKNQPFFLYHPTQLPHGPVAIQQIDPEIAADSLLTPIEKEYASMVKLLDNHVGVILQTLRELGLEENTMIVFASDNGHEIYYSQPGRCEKPYREISSGRYFDDYELKYYSDAAGDRFNGNAGMAGLKRSNLNGGVNIPMTFYWKGKLPAGRVSQQVIAGYDFLPTMAELTGVEVQKDGISYLDHLFNGTPLRSDRYIVYGSNYGPAIVTNEGWKLRYYKPKGLFELYNLHEDPKETTDLYSRYPELAEKLRQQLLRECDGDLEKGVNRAG